MRVIHVDTGRDWRGGQSQVLMLASGMRDRGWDVWVAARKGSPLADRAREMGIACTEFAFRFEADPGSAFQLSGLRAPGNTPTFFHAHTPHALGVSILSRAIGGPVKVLFTRRVAFPIKKLFINRWKLNQADQLIAVSDAVAAELARGGIEESKIRVIHSAVDTDVFKYQGPRITDSLNIVILGAIERAKGISEAMRLVEMARDLPVRFHFIGTGSDLAQVQEWASELDSVQVHGFVSDVAGFMRGMFGAISFSPSEGFPNLILQAMASGLPVAAYDNAAVREVFAGEDTGLIFENNEEALARIRGWMSDKEKALELGRRASEWVRERYSHNRMVERTVELYKELSS